MRSTTTSPSTRINIAALLGINVPFGLAQASDTGALLRPEAGLERPLGKAYDLTV